MQVLYYSILIIVILSGCTTQLKPTENSLATQECTRLCENALKEGKDLSNGPCLSDNNSEWKIEDWVCDVAHSPRTAVDNQRENQCNEWREGYNEGSPPKFVEVTSGCEFIKKG